MNIRSIALRGLFGHAHTALDLPEAGIVLVRGENGSGKSALLETVAVALWGKTLRGSSPWVPDQQSEAVVRTDNLVVERLRSAKGRLELKFRTPGESVSTVYDTASKAQDALDARIGPFDRWRRTHVFSSQDAAHFSTATDSERKRLLEVLLGLERLDGASVACHEDFRAAREAFVRAQAQCESAQREVENALDAFDTFHSALPEVPSEESVIAWGNKLLVARTALERIMQDVRSVKGTAQRAETHASETSMELQRVQQSLRTLANEKCPACEQSIGRIYKAERQGTLNQQAEHALAQSRSAQQEARHAREALDFALQAEHRAQQRERTASAEHQRARDDRECTAALRERLEQSRGVLSTQAQDAAKGFARYRAVLARLQGEFGELQEADKVLGLSGVRAHLLGRALAVLTSSANGWLAQLAPGLTVELTPTATNSKGGVKDALGLTVHGAGGGQGYPGASGGERRRIDVALLLALADLCSAAHGGVAGTLFFDEVFDTLDEGGIQAVCSVLGAQARHRTCVVVTHDARLTAQLHNVRAYWTVEAGKVTEKNE